MSKILAVKHSYAASFSEPGRRTLNEDRIFPISPESTDRLYLVCDGVGGSNKGEIASDLVTKSLYQSLNSSATITESHIHKAVAKAEEEIKYHIASNPQCEGMATTVSGVHFGESSFTGFWIGDSRIYHLRAGEVLFKSKDHSLMQMLIDNGRLSEEDARVFPMRNVILQAIGDGSKKAIATVVNFENIEENDLFLLLSDGVLEGADENILTELFNGSISISDATQILRRKCEEKSKDNYSLMVVEIKKKKS